MNGIYKIFTFFLLGYSALLNGQVNLVPNPGFENITTCPPLYYSLVYYAQPWFQPCTFNGNVTNSCSSDLYNVCEGTVNNFSCGVPANFCGSQLPRTGNGYAGIGSYFHPPSNAREYLEVPLSAALIAGKLYCFEYYVSLADISEYAISTMDAYFSKDSLLDTIYWVIPNIIPQIQNPPSNMLADKNGWTRIAGSYLATGGEKFLTIGNFHDYLTSNDTIIGPITNASRAYYYIDDVSLIEVESAICSNDVNLCASDTVSLGFNSSDSAQYSWSPLTGLSCTNCPNPKVYVNQSTTYTLKKQQCNSVTMDSVIITIKNDCESLSIPNVFTPNGDAKNDTFTVASFGIRITNITIYNRWGTIIYQPEIKNNKFGWDGTDNGKTCIDGTYFYVIEYIDVKGRMQKKKGYISLFR